MFCQQCGSQVDEGANFCAQCGTRIAGEPAPAEMVDSDEPLLVVRPVFIPWVTVLAVIPLQIFFTIWAGMFFGGFGMVAVKALKLPLPPWFTFAFFGTLSFFGIPVLAYTSKKKTYAKTEFRFYRTKLDYYEGFFTVEEKTVAYRNITEVQVRKGIAQRKYGLGTIILSTLGTGYSRGSAVNGIVVNDIENPDEVYRQLKTLIQSQSG